MSKITPIYHYFTPELGDRWIAYRDQRNMQTVENQLSGLMTFVGPGVITGWDVTKMATPTGDAILDSVILLEQQALISADPSSYLGRQYVALGSPTTSDDWKQIIRVTPGTGIVGVFRAYTDQTVYFRYSQQNVFYVWAEAGACLTTEGRALITSPSDPQVDYDTRHTATYLATIDVVTDINTSKIYVDRIEYEDRRQQLKNLEGALRAALKKSFYRHVHLGGFDHPSKIKLNTSLVLKADAPLGSTIFLVLDSNGNTFTWKSSDYGIPQVKLNNRVLSPSDYVLVPSLGRIYLKNSLPAGALLQVILPLSPQIQLTIWPGSVLSDTPAYLTDGVDLQQSSDGSSPGKRKFTWDAGVYRPVDVYLGGNLISPNHYTVDSNRAGIYFDLTWLSGTSYTGTDLIVILTHIGDEIQGKLSGKRLTNIDASSFNKGVLDSRRIAGLDHVGETRFKDIASLNPHLRLLSEGDHTTFYPEILNSPLQYGTDVFTIYNSLNFSGKPIILGTKRGLMQTSNAQDVSFQTAWHDFNLDKGEPVQIIDNTLNGEPFENHFKTSFIRTKEGRIYYTSDFGGGWSPLPMPSIPISGGSIIPNATAFWVDTQRDQYEDHGIVKYHWSTNLWLGTDRGLWLANVRSDQKLDDVSWRQDSVLNKDSGIVYSVFELVTIARTIDDFGTLESYTRTLYVGHQNGFYINGSLYSNDIVKGFLWIKDGNSQNNIIWWTDHYAYITHTAKYVVVETSTSTTTYWTHPLTAWIAHSEAASVRIATTSAIVNLSGGAPNIVDGVTLSNNDRVLVKDQVDASQNGVYVVDAVGTGVSGSWSRATDFNSSNEFAQFTLLSVTAGTINSGSKWYLPETSYALGTDNIIWSINKYVLFNNSSEVFSYAYVRPGYTQYFILSNMRPYLVTDAFLGKSPTSVALTWDTSAQSSPRAILRLPSALTADVFIVCSSRGLWKTSDLGVTWNRTVNQFLQAHKPTVYDATTGAIVIAPPTSIHNQASQSFVFGSSRSAWENFVYERDYQEYFVSPWIENNADVIVYINDEVTNIAYSLTPSLGKIHFTQGLLPTDIVKVTIVRNGAFISDVGITPHAELFNVFVVSDLSSGKLAQDFPSTDNPSIVYVDPANAIPVTTKYIELRFKTNRERLNIYVNPDTLTISLTRPRSGTFKFPAKFTDVYIVNIENVLGIEDKISILQSGQPYHLNSLVGQNIIQQSISLKQLDSSAFTRFSGSGTQADRGPKNALFFDFSSETPDTNASSSSIYVGLEPNATDSPVTPHTIYSIDNATSNGVGIRAGTNQGIWEFDGTKWYKESDLGGASKTYFIKTINSLLTVGTDKGVFIKDGSNNWNLNPTFPESTFDYLSGPWFGGTFTAWGKEDGLAFLYQKDSSTPFITDHFDTLDAHKVYGLFYGQFIRVTTNANGDSTQTKIDAIYLATDQGLYGLTQGDRGGKYSSLLNGREMFGDTPITVPYTSPDGSVSNIPVKFYQIFQSSRPKTVPIILLTSNGIYVIRNWRWSDPVDPTTVPFFVESHSLDGISCQSHVLSTETTSTGEILYKMFVGTSQGVFRSYNEGYTWEKCERLGGHNTPVYDLKMVGSCLLVGTDDGFWASSDDGDTWHKPEDSSSCVSFNSNVTDGISFGGAYLGQTFVGLSSLTAINKVSLYLDIKLPSDLTARTASLNNTLEVGIFATDGSGNPTTIIGSPASLLAASDVAYPHFCSFTLNVTLPTAGATYAVVAREIISGGGISVFEWVKSAKSNPFASGIGAMKASGAGSWTSATNQDFYFRAYFNPPPTPVLTDVSADFGSGNSRGTIINDNGELTTDSKFATVIVVDDSASANWSDPSNRISPELVELMTTLWNRTKTTVDSVNYYQSYADFWVFNTTELERTNGYSNDLTGSLVLYAGALLEKGVSSFLYDTASIAISGLSPQSLVDAILIPGDVLGNYNRMTQIVHYLNGKSLLGLADINSWYATQVQDSSSVWDGTMNDIANRDDVSNYVAQKWARSFTPVIFVIADGDNNGPATELEVASAANSTWDDNGVSVFTYGLGRSHYQNGLRTIADLTHGRHFDISNGTENQDWDFATNSFVHGGANNLFKASWTKDFDFSDPTWVRHIHTDYSTPGGSACLVEVQYTMDRINWTNWFAVTSGTGNEFVIDDAILGLKYRITFHDGWNGTSSISPKVTSLYHRVITPSRKYLVTTKQPISGMVFEYLLSAAVDLPKTARSAWGIVRGDSTDFADFETIINGRKGALPNRQQSIQYTPLITKVGLTTTTVDNLAYQVIDNNQHAKWTSTDIVQVVQSGITIGSGYSLDGNLGIIYFENVQPDGFPVTVNITTPQQLYNSIGEPTTTRDNRTYFAVNGRWSHDSQVIVLVNGFIKRGGFWVSSEEGSVTFSKERELKDIVTIFVQSAPYYRVGVEIKNYSDSPVTLNNFGLYYTTLNNQPLIYRYNNAPIPTLVNNVVNLLPAAPNNTIYNRLSVSYQFKSIEGSEEDGTTITWWKKTPGDVTVYPIMDSNGFVKITSANGFPEYNNRTVERHADLGSSGLFHQGDMVYVTVTPSDGISDQDGNPRGVPVSSKVMTLIGNQIPYVDSLLINAVGKVEDPAGSGLFYAPKTSQLIAQYAFHDADSGPNQSIITWYEKDSSTIYHIGATIDAGTTLTGQVLSFTVTPYDGQSYGRDVRSDYITIR